MALDNARQLEMPSREDMLHRTAKNHYFWQNNTDLLEAAWKEWSETDKRGRSLPPLDDSLYAPALRKAIEEAWKDPSKEGAVKDLWTEIAPGLGVYKCQFFDPEKLRALKAHMDEAHKAGIPVRPPHGITLNRRGFMLDPRSEGYLASPVFQDFYRNLMDTYMRPLGRLFYPEWVQEADDSNTFGFSIEYQPSKDQGIQEHTDASAVTLNLNFNLPEDDFSGSSLYFRDASHNKVMVDFTPGMAVIARGQVAHAALPITSGERSNLVLWMYGKNGHIRHYPYDASHRMSREQRWTKPASSAVRDKWAAF